VRGRSYPRRGHLGCGQARRRGARRDPPDQTAAAAPPRSPYTPHNSPRAPGRRSVSGRRPARRGSPAYTRTHAHSHAPARQGRHLDRHRGHLDFTSQPQSVARARRSCRTRRTQWPTQTRSSGRSWRRGWRRWASASRRSRPARHVPQPMDTRTSLHTRVTCMHACLPCPRFLFTCQPQTLRLALTTTRACTHTHTHECLC
jgi:hypothetical protein